MFGWFSSKPKKPETWTSVEHMLQELSMRPGSEVRNRAYFSERNFKLFIPVIEKSGGQWAVYYQDTTLEKEESRKYKYVTMIGVQGKPKILLEIMQQPVYEGTLIYFIDMEKAYSYQMKCIEAASTLDDGEEVELNLPVQEAIDAMELMVDYDELYTVPDNLQCKVEHYTCTSNSILRAGPWEREWYRCIVSRDNGKRVVVCFELTGRHKQCTLRRISEIPDGTYEWSKSYNKIKTIN